MRLATEALYGWLMEIEFFSVYFEVFYISDLLTCVSVVPEAKVYRVFDVSGNFARDLDLEI